MGAPTSTDDAPPDEVGGYFAPPRAGRAALYVAVPVGIVLLLLVVVLFTRKGADEKATYTPLQDKPVPEVKGTTIEGSTYDIDEHRGRWVVVNFFATWCVPCQQEHPELTSFARRHLQDGKADVVSVVFQDDPAKVRAYFAQNGGEWPVILGSDTDFALAFSITGVPESFVVDPFGIVRARLIGGVTSAGLDAEIGRLDAALFGGGSSSASSGAGG
jgi:cytochrome c biogenesis protein CcmG/thiol:disulfide interchange protein DsbE